MVGLNSIFAIIMGMNFVIEVVNDFIIVVVVRMTLYSMDSFLVMAPSFVTVIA